jgi:protein SCO1/2/putative membrane protein
MILLTLWRAYRRQWEKHRRIARPTFWIWLYVSVTGVVIYWMLYHLFPTMRGS